MEKHVAHYPLDLVKRYIEREDYHFTRTSKVTILRELGITLNVALDILQSLAPADLHKSMTCHYNHKLWQDVYKKLWNEQKLYIKLQVVDEETIIISFKQDEEW